MWQTRVAISHVSYQREILCSMKKLKNLHINQHRILGGTAQISTGWYQEPHLGVKATRNWNFVSIDDWLRFLRYYVSYYIVVLPHGEQRRILKAENQEETFK